MAAGNTKKGGGLGLKRRRARLTEGGGGGGQVERALELAKDSDKYLSLVSPGPGPKSADAKAAADQLTLAQPASDSPAPQRRVTGSTRVGQSEIEYKSAACAVRVTATVTEVPACHSVPGTLRAWGPGAATVAVDRDQGPLYECQCLEWKLGMLRIKFPALAPVPAPVLAPAPAPALAPETGAC
eukprot:3413362-Rhodomonas_salina.1